MITLVSLQSISRWAAASRWSSSALVHRSPHQMLVLCLGRDDKLCFLLYHVLLVTWIQLSSVVTSIFHSRCFFKAVASPSVWSYGKQWIKNIKRAVDKEYTPAEETDPSSIDRYNGFPLSTPHTWYRTSDTIWINEGLTSCDVELTKDWYVQLDILKR